MGSSLTDRINGTYVLYLDLMATRSGAAFKPMEEQGTHAEGTPAESQGTTGGTLPELANLTELVRVMREDRERREREIAEERERRDREIAEERNRRDREREESECRIAETHRQMEELQKMFLEHSVAVASTRGRSTTEPIKLTRLAEGDDIESYLTTFERIMAANEVRRERWSYQLAPYLTGRAQQAYAALPPEDAKEYDTVKEAILRRYDINDETYRQRFRGLRPKEGESPQEIITGLRDLATRWSRESRS